MRENLTGEESSAESHMSKHPQDSILNRLIRVLEWANKGYPSDGWAAYLTSLKIESHRLDSRAPRWLL